MGLRNRTSLTDYNCFFVTTTCFNWEILFLSYKYYQLILNSIVFLNKKYNVQIIGYVIMPNHIHLIIYFEKETHLSEYMRDFKKFTSGEIRRMIERDGEVKLLDRLRFENREQKFKIWMDRFDDLFIYKKETLETKLNYIHQNPVRKGLVSTSRDYEYSSAKFYYSGKEGLIPVLHYYELF